MKLKDDLMVFGVLALVALGVLLGTRGKTAAVGAFNAVDGTLTGAVFSIPGATLFQDSSGNFNPANAGNEAGLAVHDAVVNAVGGVVNTLSTMPPPAEGMGAAQTDFGNYVSM